MKKLMKNKKVIVFLVLVLGIMLAGVTYAWFTVNAPPSDTDIQAGRLRLEQCRYEVYYEIDDNDNRVARSNPIYVYYDLIDGSVIEDQRLNYPGAKGFEAAENWLDPSNLIQPSSSGAIGFMISNPNPDGFALPETVKIRNTLGKIIICSDIDDVSGNTIQLDRAESKTYTNMAGLMAEHDDVKITDLTYNLNSDTARNVYYWIDGRLAGMALWSYDENVLDATGEYEYYVTLSALPQGYDAKIKMVSYLTLDDPANNRFQGSLITLTTQFTSTQAIADAFPSMWGNINLQPIMGKNSPEDVVMTDGNPGIRSANELAAEAYDFTARSLSREDVKAMSELDIARFFFPEMFN